MKRLMMVAAVTALLFAVGSFAQSNSARAGGWAYGYGYGYGYAGCGWRYYDCCPRYSYYPYYRSYYPGYYGYYGYYPAYYPPHLRHRFWGSRRWW
jgi:hypothetical protein